MISISTSWQLIIRRPDRRDAAARCCPDALTDLSLRQLLSFRAVANEGSFHGAADALDYTQSAVSQHVMALEAALGVRLFDRGRGPPDGRAHRGRPSAPAPRRDDHGPPPGRARGPARLRGGRDRHAARRRVPERRNAGAAGDHRALRGGVAGRRGAACTEANSDQGLFELRRTGRARPVVRRAAAARRVRSRRSSCSRTRSCWSPPRTRRWPAFAACRPCELIGEQRLIGFRSCRSTRWVEDHLRARGRRAELRVPIRGQRHGPGDGRRRARHGPGAAPGRRRDRSRDPDHPDRPAATSHRAHLAPRSLPVAGGARLRRDRPARSRRGSGWSSTPCLGAPPRPPR